MIELIDELRSIDEALRDTTICANDLAYGSTLNSLLENIKIVENAWCGSWFGYRANVYYRDFDAPTSDMYNSNNWESEAKPIRESQKDSCWCKYSDSQVDNAIEDGIKRSDIRNAFDHTGQSIDRFGEKKEDILSIIGIAQESHSSLFNRLANRAEHLHIPTVDEIAESNKPSMLETEDPVAKQQGIRIPPHIRYYARVIRSIRSAEKVYELSKVVENTIAQIQRVCTTEASPQITGNKVFIGHGRDRSWLELQIFLRDKLGLPILEFNKESAAGSEILDHVLSLINGAAIAFLVMTGEDIVKDGDGKERRHPRLNVVHELGICQWRLGAKRAIALVEKGCDVPSNIIGVNHIPFEKGNIMSASQEIRDVLEREEIR